MLNSVKSKYFLAAEKEIHLLEKKYKNKLIINSDLSRSIVSFQANKIESVFRWFHYREGFSKTLIDYLLNYLNAKEGDVLLDPFAGTGASAFASSKYGLDSYAVELLPVGCFFMKARKAFNTLKNKTIIKYAEEGLKNKYWLSCNKITWSYPHLRITKGAFNTETELEISKYKSWVKTLNGNKKIFFDFVLFSILEKISYTRKDGQYLRWDHRAKRNIKTKFDKGVIESFDNALCEKLNNIIDDLKHNDNYELFESVNTKHEGNVKIFCGSVFEKINDIPNKCIDYVITSPPYCNRYDYTRTYALELAYLNIDEIKIRSLRQTLLTCTVENKPKEFAHIPNQLIKLAEKTFKSQKALSYIINFLEDESKQGMLNNKGIVSMVKGYFYDTTVHLYQAADKMKTGGIYVMVNDNVSYNGLNIPVDCILTSIAEAIGFKCEVIWVLPNGKGKSSQQMAKYGRNEQRKCVYIWSKL